MKKRTNCLNCPDRHVGCHSTCEVYKKMRERYDLIAKSRAKVRANRYNDRFTKTGGLKDTRKAKGRKL